MLSFDLTRFIQTSPGLERGIVEEPCEFTVITKDAGPGGLSLAVEGPSKSEIQCVDNGDGSCSVSYVPKEPGKYLFDVTDFFRMCKRY